MSLFDNIIEVLQEFKNDIISSLKNEIINFKQEIINLNKEKDKEINILKEELLRTRQELEQSQSQQIEYQKEILELQQSFKKLKNQIPSNLPKITEKNNYEELISNCFGLCHLDKFDIRNIQQIDEIYVKVKNIMDDDNEYIIADKSFLDNYKCNNPHLVTLYIDNDKTDFVITNKGKVFIKYDNSDYPLDCNQTYVTGYYYVDFNIKYVSYQFIYLIIISIIRVRAISGLNHRIHRTQPLLKWLMSYITEK